MAKRFEAFALPVRELDSTDVLEIDRAAGVEIAKVREQGATRVLIIHTYRLCHHSKSDDHRPEAEVTARWSKEPLGIHAGRISGDAKARIHREVEDALSEVVAAARALP